MRTSTLSRSLAGLFLPALTAILQPCGAETPAPISVPVSTSFLGYDGLWSPFNIRVGSPAQWLSVLPNTASQETWVIGPGGCDGTATCLQKRGGIFNRDRSTSSTDLGPFELFFDVQLGDTGYADYILDTIALSDEIVLDEQVVGILNTTEFWLGQLGLGVQPIQFDGPAWHHTFLASMVENASLIPSHSYGYTAGAYYRLKSVPASLTLGGVDRNRFIPNSASFTLSPDQQPVVAINSISVRAEPSQPSKSLPPWSGKSLTLLDASQADLFTIDSSTPFLWLPDSVCDNFANTFNLTYDETLQLYLFADAGISPFDLTQWNLTFTFSISDLVESPNNIEVDLPYDAFNLQLTYPFPGLDSNFTSAPSNYFPLRRAGNDTQYTIGRSFLQETYLAVDYERNNFSISQAKFAFDALTNMNLEAITRPANSNYTGPQLSNTSTTNSRMKIGIEIAAAVIIAVSAGMLCCFIVIRKRRKQQSQGFESTKPSMIQNERQQEGSVCELAGDNRHPRLELQGDKYHPAEAAGDAPKHPSELSGSVPTEMAADEVPLSYLTARSERKPFVAIPTNDPIARAVLRERDLIKLNTETTTPMVVQSPVSPFFSPNAAGWPIDDSVSPNSFTSKGNRSRNLIGARSGQLVNPLKRGGSELSAPSTQGSSSLSQKQSPVVSLLPILRSLPSPQRAVAPRFVSVVSWVNENTHRFPGSSHQIQDDHVNCEHAESSLAIPSPEQTARFSWEA